MDSFDSLNAGNCFHNDIKALLEDKPVLQYAAFNWYEHAMLGGNDAMDALCSPRYAPVLDTSKPSFWVWFLILADYMCTNYLRPESIISSAWVEGYNQYRESLKYGHIMREICLAKTFRMDRKMKDLFDDPSLSSTNAA